MSVVVATLVSSEAMASPWALRRVQPETTPVVPPAPELEHAAEEPGVAPSATQPAPVPPPMATPANGPGSTDVLGYRPGAVRLPVMVEREPATGMGLLGGGIALSVVGAALVGGGAAVLVTHKSAFESDSFDEGIDNGLSRIGGVILIALGVGPLVGGVVMTAIGAGQASEHRAWQKRQLAPSVGRTRHGSWTVGVQLTF